MEFATIQQQPDRNTRFHLEHLEETAFPAKVCPPVDGAKDRRHEELPMIQELLAGAGEVRNVVAANEAETIFCH